MRFALLFALFGSACAASLPHPCDTWLVAADGSVTEEQVPTLVAAIDAWHDPRLLWAGHLHETFTGDIDAFVLVRTDWRGDKVKGNLAVTRASGPADGCAAMLNVWVSPEVWWSSEAVVKDVLRHEIGHVLGHGHTNTGWMSRTAHEDITD